MEISLGLISKPPRVSKNAHAIILGCGTSTGVPVLACKCKTCSSTDPRNTRHRASVVIRAKGKTFLIDTSPDLRAQGHANNIHWIDAVLYTHPHADHLHGVDDLRTYNFLMGRSIPVYGNEWTINELREKFSYIFKKTQEGGGKPRLDLKLITKATMVHGIKVIPLPLIHGGMPVLGYRIENIAYITDCSYIPDKTMPLLRDLDVLILDCLRPSKHPTHLCIDEAIELADRIQAKATYFTHMGHEIEYKSFAKTLPPRMYPAYDGLVIQSATRRKL